MRKLVAIGFWNDGSDGCPLHNPQEFVDEAWDGDLREALVHYLAGGAVCARYRAPSWCRFACGVEPGELGATDLTDGFWVWPAGLGHYVERHDLRLPDELVEHARARDFRAACAGLDQPAECSLAFWTEWCAKHSNRDPRAVGIWRRTRQQIQAERARILERLVAQHGGLGDATCSWVGCARPVLNRLAFCPECAHARMQLWP